MDDKDAIKHIILQGFQFLFFATLLGSVVNPKYEHALNMWKKFEQDISCQNRFFPSAEPILNAVKFFSDTAVYPLKKGKKVYRARRMNKIDLSDETQKLIELIKGSSELPKDNLEFTEKKLWEHIAVSGQIKHFTDQISQFTDQKGDLLDKYKQDGFWGFNAKDSDAPPSDKAVAGRMNPLGISYLYAAENPLTAIFEARPILGQAISVAEIEIKNELKLFDFCVVPDIKKIVHYNEEELQHYFIFVVISKIFSMPNYNSDIDYCATQYISEVIKNHLGFDGIRFASSLHKDGVNIVLFNTSKNKRGQPINYSIKKSSIHVVNNITISEETILPQNSDDLTSPR